MKSMFGRKYRIVSWLCIVAHLNLFMAPFQVARASKTTTDEIESSLHSKQLASKANLSMDDILDLELQLSENSSPPQPSTSYWSYLQGMTRSARSSFCSAMNEFFWYDSVPLIFTELAAKACGLTTEEYILAFVVGKSIYNDFVYKLSPYLLLLRKRNSIAASEENKIYRAKQALGEVGVACKSIISPNSIKIAIVLGFPILCKAAKMNLLSSYNDTIGSEDPLNVTPTFFGSNYTSSRKPTYESTQVDPSVLLVIILGSFPIGIGVAVLCLYCKWRGANGHQLAESDGEEDSGSGSNCTIEMPEKVEKFDLKDVSTTNVGNILTQLNTIRDPADRHNQTWSYIKQAQSLLVGNPELSPLLFALCNVMTDKKYRHYEKAISLQVDCLTETLSQYLKEEDVKGILFQEFEKIKDLERRQEVIWNFIEKNNLLISELLIDLCDCIQPDHPRYNDAIFAKANFIFTDKTLIVREKYRRAMEVLLRTVNSDDNAKVFLQNLAQKYYNNGIGGEIPEEFNLEFTTKNEIDLFFALVDQNRKSS